MENKLIILLVVIFAAIAVAQLVRVYELSSKLRGKNEHEISSRDNNFNALLLLLFMFFQFFGFFSGKISVEALTPLLDPPKNP